MTRLILAHRNTRKSKSCSRPFLFFVLFVFFVVPLLQLLGFKFAIAFIEITDVDAFHEQGAVIDPVGQRTF